MLDADGQVKVPRRHLSSLLFNPDPHTRACAIALYPYPLFP